VTYSVVVLPSAIRQINSLPKKGRKRVWDRVEALAKNPRPSGAKQLKNRDRYWRLRVGEYRVIYSIEDKKLLVTVVRVGHRREVYR